jgi:hypothetical protein
LATTFSAGLGMSVTMTLATPEPIKDWSLTCLQEKSIKIGLKLVSYSRHIAFLIGCDLAIREICCVAIAKLDPRQRAH